MSIAAACAARARVIEAQKVMSKLERKFHKAVIACQEGKESLSAEARRFLHVFVVDRAHSMKTQTDRWIYDGDVESDIHSVMDEIMTMPIMDGVQVEVTEERRDMLGEAKEDGEELWYHVVLTWPGPAVKSAGKTA